MQAEVYKLFDVVFPEKTCNAFFSNQCTILVSNKTILTEAIIHLIHYVTTHLFLLFNQVRSPNNSNNNILSQACQELLGFFGSFLFQQSLPSSNNQITCLGSVNVPSTSNNTKILLFLANSAIFPLVQNTVTVLFQSVKIL